MLFCSKFPVKALYILAPCVTDCTPEPTSVLVPTGVRYCFNKELIDYLLKLLSKYSEKLL